MSDSLDDIQRVEEEIAALGERIEALAETQPAESAPPQPPPPHQQLAEGLRAAQSTWDTIEA